MRKMGIVPSSRGPDFSISPASGRILVVAPEPFFENRGTPIALKRILEAASERSINVDLLTFPVGDPVALMGLRIFRVATWIPIRKVPIGFSLRKVLLDFFMVPAILKLTRRGAYSCIYALEEAAFLAMILRPWHKLPVLYDMQSSLPEQLMEYRVFRWPLIQRLLRSIEKWMIRNADRIVCSAGLRDYILGIEPAARVQEWRFPAEPVEHRESDVEQLRKDLGIPPGSPVVLYTGNFEPYQGVDRLLHAASKVISQIPDTVFLLVGETGPSDFPVPEPIGRLKQQGSLRLIPRQSQSEVSRFLAMADIVVSPRDGTRNVGLKIFEYLAAGKPIVATDTLAHRRVLDEERAVLVNLSPDDLGKAIVDLLRDPARSNRLGLAARAYAEENLGWKPFVKQVGDLYNLMGS
jgi:glycosyltransferase involved in cell wall biosynthesis